MINITLYYDDLDQHISDLREYVEVIRKKCNDLKRNTDGEQSVQYDILEQYFNKLHAFLIENNNVILCNLNSITDISLSDDNIFNKKSN